MFSLNDRSIRLKQVGPLLGGSLVEPKIAQLVCLTNYFGVVSCRCDGDLRSLREVRTAQQWSVRRLWPCAIQHGRPQAVPHGACVHGTVPPQPGQCARHHERESGATWAPRDEVGSSTGSRTCSEVCWWYALFHLPARCVSGIFSHVGVGASAGDGCRRRCSRHSFLIDVLVRFAGRGTLPGLRRRVHCGICLACLTVWRVCFDDYLHAGCDNPRSTSSPSSAISFGSLLCCGACWDGTGSARRY